MSGWNNSICFNTPDYMKSVFVSFLPIRNKIKTLPQKPAQTPHSLLFEVWGKDFLFSPLWRISLISRPSLLLPFSKTSWPLLPSHLHGSHLKNMFQLSLIILFIPPFFNLPLRLSCSLAQSSEVSASSRNFFKLLISAVSSKHSLSYFRIQIFVPRI